jgi:hypothetical protein
MVLFAGYLVLWAVAVSGALVSGCGLATENITGGAEPANAVCSVIVSVSRHESGIVRIAG